MYKGKTRSAGEVIVFSIITCGIYFLYWIYSFATEMKTYMNDNASNPGVELALCIFCYPYQYYWFYRYGKTITEAQKRAGLQPEDNSVLYLILAIFGLGIVNAAIMQSSVNKIWEQQ
ncbi:MAG: DUF4234 domain-containing protein [Clostridia bacterium]|nr:DUF4234 domain-containing protein [Clostridia bacterium]